MPTCRRHWSAKAPGAIAAQLYSLRSSRNDGIGDFSDLATLARLADAQGASAVALNPLHQLHVTNAAAPSPYAPLSRRYLNALYIDVHAAAARFGVSLADFDTRALRDAPLIAYERVAAFKLEALERIFDALREQRPWASFAAADPGLRDVARYEAIMEMLTALDPDVYGWQQWPTELQDARGAAVERFATQHASRVDFFVFAQWLADGQLEAAARTPAACRSASIAISRSASISTVPTCGAIPVPTRSAFRLARRPIRSTRRDRIGVCHRSIRASCANATTHRSSPCYARTCATPVHCASIT